MPLRRDILTVVTSLSLLGYVAVGQPSYAQVNDDGSGQAVSSAEASANNKEENVEALKAQVKYLKASLAQALQAFEAEASRLKQQDSAETEHELVVREQDQKLLQELQKAKSDLEKTTQQLEFAKQDLEQTNMILEQEKQMALEENEALRDELGRVSRIASLANQKVQIPGIETKVSKDGDFVLDTVVEPVEVQSLDDDVLMETLPTMSQKISGSPALPEQAMSGAEGLMNDNAAEAETGGLTQAQAYEAEMKRRSDYVASVSADDDMGGEMRMSADPFEGMRVMGGRTAGGNKAQMPDVKKAETGAFTKTVMTSRPVRGVGAVLAASNVPGLSAVKRVDTDGAKGDVDAYQWKVGGVVFGSGEQRVLNSIDQFDDYVLQYLLRTEKRCAGEYAVIPVDTVENDMMRADTYDVACVGNDVGSYASLLFYNDGEMFSVLAHEAPTHNMEKAMEVRDMIFVRLGI